jgi:hypothetical protein
MERERTLLRAPDPQRDQAPWDWSACPLYGRNILQQYNGSKALTAVIIVNSAVESGA